MKKQLTIILLIFGFANATYAEPSEQETIKYLEGKVAGCGKWATAGIPDKSDTKSQHLLYPKEKITSMKINNKILIVNEITEGHFENTTNPEAGWFFHKKREYHSQAMLKNLDPNIKIENQTIIVSCNSGSCFQAKERDKRKEGENKEDGYGEQFLPWKKDWSKWELQDKSSFKQYYTFCSDEGAKKIAKALSHLIKLNGGKAELF